MPGNRQPADVHGSFDRHEARGTAHNLATEQPVRVNLPDGRSLQVRGRIDRINKVAASKANTFAIWDYKTGGTWKFTQERRPFWAGRLVQHGALHDGDEQSIPALPDEFPGASVERFGYFFPSEKGNGEKSTSSRAARVRRPGSGSVTRIASSGAFLATNQHDKDCNFCDYIGICGDVASVAEASAGKLKSRIEPDSDTLCGAAQRWQNQSKKPDTGQSPDGASLPPDEGVPSDRPGARPHCPCRGGRRHGQDHELVRAWSA